VEGQQNIPSWLRETKLQISFRRKRYLQMVVRRAVWIARGKSLIGFFISAETKLICPSVEGGKSFVTLSHPEVNDIKSAKHHHKSKMQEVGLSSNCQSHSQVAVERLAGRGI
jgi:hypothetical protein